MNNPSFRKTALIVLDGFGIAPFDRPGNAIRPDTATHILGNRDKYA